MKWQHVVSKLIIILATCSISFGQKTTEAPSSFDVAIRREGDLVHLLFDKNDNFDLEMCKAVNADLNKGAIVSYELASFVFYYPSSNYWVASSTEMSLPGLLICKGGRVSRRETTNEIPVNCVRLVDPSKRDILAEADFLLGVTPMENPGQHKYIRRSLRFIYRDGWKKGNAQ